MSTAILPTESLPLPASALVPSPLPPPWACAWGDDRYGLWADFDVLLGEQTIVQRMRWIEPGVFMMGSPPEEAERLDNEGPQHQVSIGKGFWLADTACTQALWQAVTGENPAMFHSENKGGPAHPVEQVSWDMIQAFLPKLQAMLAGCIVTLPNEAEWEYACRAGAVTPFSFGETISTKQVNYYGDAYGNGKEGETRGQTVAVKALPANRWGLYQMHGNVWEWCADRWREYDLNPVSDPGLAQALEPVLADRAVRVLRGGGVNSNARYVRSACRDHDQPVRRYRFMGFRLALRSQSQASRG